MSGLQSLIDHAFVYLFTDAFINDVITSVMPESVRMAANDEGKPPGVMRWWLNLHFVGGFGKDHELRSSQF